MILHQHKLIFIHIPKCAGSSIRDHFFNKPSLDWKEANYELLYGWCPKRRIHLQHATSKQLLESGLISKKTWNEYFKFTIVRNPFDRAYSDYLWIQKDRNIQGSFEDYILKQGQFKKFLVRNDNMSYRGDHLFEQTSFFDVEEGPYKMDFVGRFECLEDVVKKVSNKIGFSEPFKSHAKKNKKRKNHYSLFYNAKRKKLVETVFKNDLELLEYSFENRSSKFQKLFKCLFTS